MANLGTYELPHITAVSPSLAETIRNCPLQAGLSRINGVRAQVLDNPKAWLGTAYHQVLERLWTPSQLGDDARIEDLWMNAIAVLRAKADSHPLNKRYSDPEQWPGYHLVHAFAILRAQRALLDQSRQLSNINAARVILREQEFSAIDGKLIGKPDVIIGNEIRDYKSGRIYDDTPDGRQNVKLAYVRQLRLYGRLVEERLGVCPAKGVLLPMQGEAVEVPLDRQTCAAEATEAVGLLDAYNGQLETSPTIAHLATPSPRSCRWCQYKALCPAFWERVTEEWTHDLGSACVRGELVGEPLQIHNGKAFSLAIVATTGTTTGHVTITPLEGSIHGNLAAWRPHEVVRVINLYRRHDGQLAPTAATVCLREDECVRFALPTGNAGANH